MLDARHAFSLCDQARLVTGHLTIPHTRRVPAKGEEANWTDEHFLRAACLAPRLAKIGCAELCGGLHEA